MTTHTPTAIEQNIQEAVSMIESRCKIKPKIGLILGSGLGSIADHVTDPVIIPYNEIPHFHETSVEGHLGRMILGTLSGVPVVFLQGRFHFYEGYSMQEVAFPTRTICKLGIHTLVLTNAAGAINASYKPGDLMLINDHLNLMGDNPLKGPNLAQIGPRFPDLSEAYNPHCLKVLMNTAKQEAIDLHSGVYCGLLGPNYETPAEIRMLRTFGADAVGMSTVPETIAANHSGVRVCGISCITNLAAGLSPTKLSHEEVMTTSKIGAEKIKKLILKAVYNLAQPDPQADESPRSHP